MAFFLFIFLTNSSVYLLSEIIPILIETVYDTSEKAIVLS
jgi:hypothetical protein